MSSSNAHIFLPLLSQVLLTVIVYVALAVAKSRAVKQGLVDLDRRGLHDDAWPQSVQTINNNIRNQFEVPVLFYVVSLSLFVLGVAGFVAQVLAWTFVASRVVHVCIHLGANNVRARRAVFMFGCVLVLAMLVLAVVAAIR